MRLDDEFFSAEINHRQARKQGEGETLAYTNGQRPCFIILPHLFGRALEHERRSERIVWSCQRQAQAGFLACSK